MIMDIGLSLIAGVCLAVLVVEFRRIDRRVREQIERAKDDRLLSRRSDS